VIALQEIQDDDGAELTSATDASLFDSARVFFDATSRVPPSSTTSSRTCSTLTPTRTASCSAT